MGWRDAQGAHLLNGFIGQRGVSLHNPGGNFGVAFPGGILHHFPAVLLGMLHRQTNGIVIVHVGDDALRAEVENGVHALLRRAFRHVNHRMLSKLLCRPGDTATVVTVGGGGKRHFFADGVFELFERERLNIKMIFLTQQAGDGPGPAEHLERVESKAF